MKWESKLIKYKGTARISVAFEKNIELIARIKTIEGSRWSQSLGVWHIPDTEENRLRFKLPLHSISTPSQEGILQIEKFKQLVQSSKFQQFSILGLASEAGFSSKSTFYAAFKKFEGMSPKQYENSIKKSG